MNARLEAQREARPRPRLVEHELVRRAERLAERYVPTYAIVDEHFDVLHFSAKAGRFIQPSGGAPSLNLLALVHGDLRLDVRGALSKAAQERQTVRADGLQMGRPSGPTGFRWARTGSA